MPFQPGDRVGAYEILATLGAGGMGVVYRARDARLGRDVAIKTLPDDVAADPERLARFEREARALAALNHPNIATIYGFEQADATHFLTMEVVEGATLADRIERGPIPLEQALPLFVQIAQGLEAAHAKGIIHRDLKPANIKIEAGGGSGTRPGAVKILDFGLAKALMPEHEARSVGASHSPTLTLEATMRGEILGTAAYMSPEQAQGLPAEERADIWSFGVCLLEALSGRRVFKGANASFVLASVLKDEPDLDALPPSTPPPVRRLLRRCLEKKRERRLHDIADARLELEEALAAPAAEAAPTAALAGRASRMRTRIVATAVALGIALGIVGSQGIVAWRRPASRPAPLARFVLTAPPNEPAAGLSRDLAITRDGGSVYYVSGTPPTSILRVRRLDQLEGVPVAGVEPGAAYPFLSPDGRSLGYVTGYFIGGGQSTLRAVPIDGGPSRKLCAILTPVGASWGENDTIVFGSLDGPLRRVAAAGGEPQDLSALAEGEIAHQYPELLPGGRAVLFNVLTDNDQKRPAVHALSLATGERKLLVRGAIAPRYAASGHLLYNVGETLHAVAFDPERLELLGDPAPVLDGVAFSGAGGARYVVSESGALAYVVGESDVPRNALVWVDREGREEAIGAPPHSYLYPRLSPDGTRIAVGALDAERDIWIWDLERGDLDRLTFSPRGDIGPVWSPDGRTIFYSSMQESGGFDIFRVQADGTGEPTRLTEERRFLHLGAVTPDGSGLVAISTATNMTPGQMVWLDAAAKAEPRALLAAELSVYTPALSPDGRWLAYVSVELGTSEVFVRPFPAVDRGRWQVSTGGGSRPLWSRDGQEIFYLDPTWRLMGAAVAPRGDALVVRQPEVVIETPFPTSFAGRTYDVSPDGRRFLMIKSGGSPSADTSGRIVLVMNWFDELRRLAPARRSLTR